MVLVRAIIVMRGCNGSSTRHGCVQGAPVKKILHCVSSSSARRLIFIHGPCSSALLLILMVEQRKQIDRLGGQFVE